MSIFAIADLHLSFSTPEKTMEKFGENWKNYHQRIENNWREKVTDQDLVLLPGDTSWAMKLEEALIDFAWLDKLPGTKLLIKGNHDYWWASSSKMRKELPSSIHFLQNDVFIYQNVAIGGSRLWAHPEVIIDPSLHATRSDYKEPYDEKIFNREKERLILSLSKMPKNASKRIVMTHYPPLGPDMKPNEITDIFDSYHIDIALFGHLHNLKKNISLFSSLHGIDYYLTSADYIDFSPLKIL